MFGIGSQPTLNARTIDVPILNRRGRHMRNSVITRALNRFAPERFLIPEIEPDQALGHASGFSNDFPSRPFKSARRKRTDRSVQYPFTAMKPVFRSRPVSPGMGRIRYVSHRSVLVACSKTASGPKSCF
jgi:hypothetical protein